MNTCLKAVDCGKIFLDRKDITYARVIVIKPQLFICDKVTKVKIEIAHHKCSNVNFSNYDVLNVGYIYKQMFL